MILFSSLNDPKLIACLQKGGVVVAPTDTLYGLLARATDQAAVERVYRIRGRAPEKPCIVLIAHATQIADTSLWSNDLHNLAERYWPGPLSLVAPTATTPEYLHRGTHTLAYRVPHNKELQALLEQTGPLIAPSANPEGLSPATTVAEAQAYFGDTVDGYVDGGTHRGDAPSTVATIKNGKLHIFRQGVLRVIAQ